MFFAVQNFRFGLDTRRSEYTSNPGTLLTLDNCVVNQGGEIEKRWSFSRGTVTGWGTTFGLVAGEDRLFVFSSQVIQAGLPATILGVLVNCITCQHPDGTTAMTGILSGTTFNGLPWVIAQFADGNIYPYYNGTLVNDFTSGLVLSSGTTNIGLGTQLAAQVNTETSGLYTAVDHGTGVVDVFNLPNALATGFSSSVVKTPINPGSPSSGILSDVFTSDGVPSVPQNAAVAQFTILSGTANPGVNGINNIKVFGIISATISRARAANVATLVLTSTTGMTTGDKIKVTGMTDSTFNVSSATVTVTGSNISYANTGANVSTIADAAGTATDISVAVEILNISVDWVTDNNHTAEAVAAQINTFVSSPDYVASSTLNVVTIFSVAANAGAYNGLILQVTAKGNVCVGDCLFTVTATASFSQLFTHFYVGTAGAGGVDLMVGYTPAGTDVTSGVAAIVAWINNASNTANGGVYLAYSQNNVIRVSKVITRSDDQPINFNIIPNTGVSVTTGTSAPLLCSVEPAFLSAVNTQVVNSKNIVTQATTCIATGGAPPYSYQWTIIPGSLSGAGQTQVGNGLALIATFPLAQSTSFTFLGSFLSIGGATPPTTSVWVCTVTDSLGNESTSNLVSVLIFP